jgi:ABC-type cobalamin/Fe3+-siderophores transport system ATPase subunit
MRTFEDKPAVREATPLLVGLIGPSGAGKTYSALRLATGIQQVCGGDIYMIDTEARRGLHYAEDFGYRHVPFAAPFSPLDYLDAIQYCVNKGAKTIIVDSMSHEHEGPGGVLEIHEAALTRMAGTDYGKRAKMTMLAWAEPKQQRRRMINSIIQMEANFIFCFRAKEKLKMERGKEPEKLGFMPQAGEEFVYEMVLKCLLLPGCKGVPTWQSERQGEQMMIKLPRQFESLFAASPQLSEAIGVRLAEWAAGAPAPSIDSLIERYQRGENVKEEVTSAWRRLSKADRDRWTAAVEASKAPEPGSLG